MTDYAVINPATGEEVKTVPTITVEELAAAFKLAHETQHR
jgi:acyl-CoA reductase-like NAD-dependent aldehyde dehydrogenase